MDSVDMVSTEKQTNASISSVFKAIRGFREGTLILIILAVCVIMSFVSPYFFTWPNLKAIMLSFSTEGIVVVGMTLILVVGGFDLSVGSVMCLAMVIGGKLFLLGVNPWLASLIGIAICSLIGFTMGIFVTKVGLNFFITTLAFMGIARGLCFVITQGTPLSLFALPKSFKFIGQGTIYSIPFTIFIFAVIVVLSDYLMRKSSLARKVFYTGSNEKAAIFSGIKTHRVKIVTCVLHPGRISRYHLYVSIRGLDSGLRHWLGVKRHLGGGHRRSQPHRWGGDGAGLDSRHCPAADHYRLNGPAGCLALLAGSDPRRHPAGRGFPGSHPPYQKARLRLVGFSVHGSRGSEVFREN